MDLRRQAVGRRGVGRPGLRVTAPASSANLGSGFDAVGLALDLPFELATEPDPSWHPCEATHPAAVTFADAGGTSPLWWRSPIPPGRGLGFSGAARVAGAFLALVLEEVGADDARAEAFAVATAREGHPDNAAASAYGGLVVSAGGRVVPVALGAAPTIVVWSPDTEVSTRRARAALPDTVPFGDAVFNVARSALLVAALASGDLAALDVATEDRLHQDRRLTASPDSAAALDGFRRAGAHAAWLSGSGPSVAAMVDEARVGPVVADADLPEGVVRRLDVALGGVEATH